MESDFGYTGEQEDESGLLFLRARYYDAETGRFLSQDPFAGTLEQPYSQHPYQYGYSNPVRYTDPSGQCVSVGNILWSAMSPDTGEFAVMRGAGSLTSAEVQSLQAECEGNLAAAGAQWAEGDWGSAGIYATGTAGEVRGTAEGFWSVHQALLTTYNPNMTWQERVLPAAEVTVFALSWAPAPGAGSLASQLDDIGRRGSQLLNSVSSCADDIARWAGGVKGGIPNLPQTSQPLFSAIGDRRATELATEELLDKIRSKGRIIYQDDPEVQRFLEWAGAAGSASNATDIMLRYDIRKMEVLEEFLHTTQYRLKLDQIYTRNEMEIQVKDFIIRHQRLLEISDHDIAIMKESLEQYWRLYHGSR